MISAPCGCELEIRLCCALGEVHSKPFVFSFTVCVWRHWVVILKILAKNLLKDVKILVVPDLMCEMLNKVSLI